MARVGPQRHRKQTKQTVGISPDNKAQHSRQWNLNIIHMWKLSAF